MCRRRIQRQPSPDAFIKQEDATITIDAEKWTEVSHDKQGKENTDVYVYTTAPKSTPRQADTTEVKPEPGKDPQTTLLIYEVDGDTLKICAARPGEKQRPTEFKSTNKSTMVRIYKRVKP